MDELRNSQLVEIATMPPLGNVSVPLDFYWVIQEAGPLGGMRHPSRHPIAPWHALRAAGFGGVLDLHDDPDLPLPYQAGDLEVARVRMEDLAHGGGPDFPDVERERLVEAVETADCWLAKGIGVVVHCCGGRGRTGTVLAALLIKHGHDPDEVTRWLQRLHRRRDKPGWPESPWQREQLEYFRGSS